MQNHSPSLTLTCFSLPLPGVTPQTQSLGIPEKQERNPVFRGTGFLPVPLAPALSWGQKDLSSQCTSVCPVLSLIP